jgi:type II restriction/modification system DNA methylase subunit YeeA
MDPLFVSDLRKAWSDRVAPAADFVCYWHEIAREQVQGGHSARAGLLATNSIRVGASRGVLDRIKATGDIFMAWSDEPWIVEGAAVRVSIIGQDDGSTTEKTLDGNLVGSIFSDLSSGVDLTVARNLRENHGLAFQGPVKVGPFEISYIRAQDFISQPNPNGRSNLDVVRPWLNGSDVVRRPRHMWIIRFPHRMREADAALYEAPYEYVREHVRPSRVNNRNEQRRKGWWRLGASAAEMDRALRGLTRYIVTPRVSKHRIFAWTSAYTVPDSRLVAVATADEYVFGILHSRPHDRWSLRTGGWHGVGNDPQYTPSASFETFPFPWPLNTPDDALTPEQQAHRDFIGEAARKLNERRERWLNPPELVREEPDVVPELPPRLVPVSEGAEKELKKRTLTNLYNARPTWLANLHRDRTPPSSPPTAGRRLPTRIRWRTRRCYAACWS